MWNCVSGNPPENAVKLGWQNDGAGELWSAVANTQWGTIPGKANRQTCWYPHNRKEHTTSDFSFVTASNYVRQVENNGTGPPLNAAKLGYEKDGAAQTYCVLANTVHGMIPGKANYDTCWYPYGGNEHMTKHFSWLTQIHK